MKEIQLTRGKITLVDNEDFEYLNQWKWQATKSLDTHYATRTYTENGIKKCARMHRIILGLKDANQFGDHIDGNGLNNQRNNLRPSTKRQNNANRRSNKNSTSKYLGVHLYTERSAALPTRRWKAQINTVDGKKHLG